MARINLTDLIEEIKTDLGITDVKMTVRRVPPPETRHNLGLCFQERGCYHVLVNEYIQDNQKLIHTLAHELRHVWQYKNNFEMDLDISYSREEYDAAREEIDADVYADSVCERYAGASVCKWM